VSYASIDELRSQLGAHRSTDSQLAYAQKMMHAVPEAPVVDREKTILEHCTGKRVLEFGASGPLHEALTKVASALLGVDRERADGVIAFDLDDVSQDGLPVLPDPDVIVCGEILEHLSNPGWFLTRLRRQYRGILTIVTVPNAFSAITAKHLARGFENVNVDHVCWYSVRTLTTLLTRAGYTDLDFAWYRGQPLTAEGLMVVTK
jgi:hypothetical protein